jgi:hypothetical protein
MAKVLCVLYDDPVDGFPPTYARDGIPTIERYPDGQTTPTPEGIDFAPGDLLGCVSGELGLRPYLEAAGHELVVTSDKDGPDSEFEKHLADAEVVNQKEGLDRCLSTRPTDPIERVPSDEPGPAAELIAIMDEARSVLSREAGGGCLQGERWSPGSVWVGLDARGRAGAPTSGALRSLLRVRRATGSLAGQGRRAAPRPRRNGSCELRGCLRGSPTGPAMRSTW